MISGRSRPSDQKGISMRFRAYDRNGTYGLAVEIDGIWRDLGMYRLADLITDGRERDRTIADGAPVMDFSGTKLLPPIPNPGKILCVGLNYVDHAAESPYVNVPKYPAFFARFASSLIPDGAPIIRPECSHELDYEGELIAVIGRRARHVSEADALDHVAGYSTFNDGSIRNYQFLAPQWTPGKNFDNTGAFGPDFVTADELPKGARGLRLEVFLNGKKMQSANTDDMVFSVAQLVSTASEFMTLEPGDIIATGTPAGVGFARKPPVFMKHGDTVEVRIEKIGTLSNPVRNEIPAA
jgi:2-keto-4-pentenoate hydratase/2-oxohepta-3-ene-1,7-dioic acid hydratase in catechol pathway